MAIFILVPAIAPAIGQILITTINWQATFYFLIAKAAIGLVWFWLRQPETLLIAARNSFSISKILLGV